MKKVALITGISGQDGLGCPDKAKQKLGWIPKVDIDGLINMMTDHDFELARKEFVIDIYDKGLQPNFGLQSKA